MAIGDTIFVFDPLANHPPASGFATLDARGNLVVLDFDANTNEQAQFYGVISSHYRGGPLEVRVTWTSTSATSGDAKLRIELTRIAAGANLDSLPSAVASDDQVVNSPATSGMLVSAVFGPLAVADLAAGEMLRLQITRLGSDGADTMTGDLEIMAVMVKEVA